MDTSWVDILPHVNATLNALAAVMLLIGYRAIKHGREESHKRWMLSCFGVSVVFLICYLTRIALEGTNRFPAYPPVIVRFGYYAVLATHVLLAAAVPFLSAATIWLGMTDRRVAHRALARWTFPIWLYVSVTGVIVYLMLYVCFPAEQPATRDGAATMRAIALPDSDLK